MAEAAKRSGADALVVCFRGGAFSAVLNCTLCVLGVAVLFALIWTSGVVADVADVPLLLVGYGFGASFVALFMQLGGGIYTKAADVGADLVGKVEASIPEDDPRNPAVIADLVGDARSGKRVIQRRFNVRGPRAIVPEKGSTLRERSER